MKLSFLLALFIYSQTGSAFTLLSNRARFATNEVSINVSSNSCSNAVVTPQELLDLAEMAAEEYWNRVPTSAMELSKGSIVAVDVSADDASTALGKAAVNTILIGCNQNTSIFTSAGTLAVGTISTDGRGMVLINDTSSTPFNTISADQKLATVAHEMGHALGVGHSADQAALMYYSIGSFKVQEKLSQDDYDALTYLYPHDGPVSCGSVALLDRAGGGSGRGGPPLMLILLIGMLLVFAIEMIFKKLVKPIKLSI